jgi:NitT/TauT family transport system permease protein
MRRAGQGAVALGAYVVAIGAIWWAYTAVTGVPAFILPSPVAVAQELEDLIVSGELLPHLLYTLRNIVLGFAIGAALGCVLAVLIHRNWIVESIAEPFLVLFQAAPKIALAPLFVLWFGLGVGSQIALVVCLAFFPILTGALGGLRSVDPHLDEVGRVMGMSPMKRLFAVQLPSALPGIFAGAKIGVVDAMTGAVLAEFISSDHGLGYLLVFGNSTYKTQILVASIVVIVAVGLVLFAVVDKAERRLLFWQETEVSP